MSEKEKEITCIFCDITEDAVYNMMAHEFKPEIKICDNCIITFHDALREKLYDDIDDLTNKVEKFVNIMGA